MEFSERNNSLGDVGYESMTWVRDGKGREYSCTLDTPRPAVHRMNELSSHEQASCVNVSDLIGTERW